MSFKQLARYYDTLSKEDNSLDLLNKGKECLRSKKFKKALDYFSSSSALGNSDAQRYLGLLYLKYDDIKLSSEEQQPLNEPAYQIGLRYLQLSASQKNKKTYYLLGILYIEGFKENARQMRRRGFFVEEETIPGPIKMPQPNKDIGIRYLQEAIKLKYKRAMKYLFDYYFRERHVDNNLERAESLAREALKIGYDDLISALIYDHYKLDKSKQIEIIELLAKNGDKEFQGIYGNYLYQELNDFANGYGYLKKSADQGNVLSMYRYGYYNLIGYTDNHGDREEGFKYLEKSARNGCLAASYYLGLFHLHADHELDKNENLAIKYFHRAAIYSDPDAQIALGKVFLYNEKRLILPDLAIKYFGLAAEGSILSINESREAYWPDYSDDDENKNSNNNNDNNNDDFEEEEEEEEDEKNNDNDFNVEAIRILYKDIPESSTSFVKTRRRRRHRRNKYKSERTNKKDGEQEDEYDYDDKVEDFDDPLVRDIYQIINEDISLKRKRKKKRVEVFIGAYAGEFSKKPDKRKIKRNYMCQGLLGLAQAYKEKKDYQKSLENYQKAINYGFAEAMNELGNIYKDGSFGKKEPQKALQLFNKAFQEQRNADALYYMGRLYTEGCGEIEKDPSKGQDLIKLAMSHGSSVAHRSYHHGGIMSLRGFFF